MRRQVKSEVLRTATTSFKQLAGSANHGLGHMITSCKEQLGVESVSIVTIGSLVDESFLRQHGKHIDTLAVSCDSSNEQTNIKIGRGNGDQIKKLFQIAGWCKNFGRSSQTQYGRMSP